MKSFMRLGVAMLCTVMAVPAFAGFSVQNNSAIVTSLGEVSGQFTVNQLTAPLPGTAALRTQANSSITQSNPLTYATTVVGNFRLFRVDVTSPNGAFGVFGVTFAQNVLGIAASNAFTSGGMGLTFDVLAKFESEASILTNLLGGNNIKGLEILGVNPNNPDSLSVNGKVVTGDVTIGNVNQGTTPEAFYVLTAVPEPASLAIWGACSVGGIIAGRRRLRKQNA